MNDFLLQRFAEEAVKIYRQKMKEGKGDRLPDLKACLMVVIARHNLGSLGQDDVQECKRRMGSILGKRGQMVVQKRRALGLLPKEKPGKTAEAAEKPKLEKPKSTDKPKRFPEYLIPIHSGYR